MNTSRMIGYPLSLALLPSLSAFAGEPNRLAVATAGIFDTDRDYIDDLLAAVKDAPSPDAAKAIMVKKYPDWANSDFILVQSIKFQTKSLKEKAR